MSSTVHAFFSRRRFGIDTREDKIKYDGQVMACSDQAWPKRSEAGLVSFYFYLLSNQTLLHSMIFYSLFLEGPVGGVIWILALRPELPHYADCDGEMPALISFLNPLLTLFRL